MKQIIRVAAVVMGACLVMGSAALAAQYAPGTYTDGEHTLVLQEDMTFSMDKTGQNMEGAEFVLTVTGTVQEDGSVVIDGLFDGDMNLVDLASEEQKAADQATVEEVLAAGQNESKDETKAVKTPADLEAGEYTDGEHTLVLKEDKTFYLEKTGQNMEGAEFKLTVTGKVLEDGSFILDGLYDGELNLIDMASEEQLAADYASVASVFEAACAEAEEEESAEAKTPADLEAGEYTDGEHTLVLKEDKSFYLEKTGQNMEGEEFKLTVTGKVLEDGSFILDGLYDGELNLIDMASEEQLAADYASVASVFEAACAK